LLLRLKHLDLTIDLSSCAPRRAIDPQSSFSGLGWQGLRASALRKRTTRSGGVPLPQHTRRS
jgi:hypothetical protein